MFVTVSIAWAAVALAFAFFGAMMLGCAFGCSRHSIDGKSCKSDWSVKAGKRVSIGDKKCSGNEWDVLWRTAYQGQIMR